MTLTREDVAQLVGLLSKLDDDVLLQWGLIEYGGVRGPAGQQILTEWKRTDLSRLSMALGMVAK